MNDNDAPAGSSAEALALAEQKLQLEQSKKIREAKIDAGVSTEPEPEAPNARLNTEK